jgi:hypothetical protein
VGALAFVLLVGMAYLSFTRPTYACANIFDPSAAPSLAATSPAPAASGSQAPVATGSPAPSASGSALPATTPPPPGYVQPDMGHLHQDPGSTITYQFCPPASGKHYNSAGIGPIRPGVYGPNDPAVPPGWVHNLEHGALVLLYSCTQAPDACTDAGQDALEALYASWPNSPLCDYPAGTRDTPVFARYDDMPWPYAGVVWDLVLPMQTLDEPLLLDFFERNAEQFAPELYQQGQHICASQPPSPAAPTVGPATASPAPSLGGSPAASPGTSPGTSPAATGAVPSPS